ncbi:MAG: tetratricopeptide repeat protein [Deltaproteobacteria bacterium]|nr:tetratricopeptide repeat protein [Deltaproteobacteria bacterium]
MINRLLLIISLLILVNSAQVLASEIKSERCDISYLKGLATQKGTNIVINFYAYWCPACRELYKKVLPAEGVKNILSEYVFARCNGEEGEGERLFNQYKITAFPTLLILDPNGKELDRIVDDIDEQKIKKTLEQIKMGKSEVDELAKKADTNPKDTELLFNVCMSYIFRADRDKAKKYCEKVLKIDQKNEKGYASQVLLSLGKYLYFRGLKDYDLAAAHLEQVLKLFPESKEARSAFIFLISSYVRGGKEGVAVMKLRELIKKNPNSKEPYKTFAYISWKNKWRIDQGIENARKATDLDPSDDDAWDLLAELYFLKGNKADAIKAIDEALKLKPSEDYYKEQKERFSK